MEILINGLQAAHIAEIAHRKSVGIPAKEWGSIPCFRSNDAVAELVDAIKQ